MKKEKESTIDMIGDESLDDEFGEEEEDITDISDLDFLGLSAFGQDPTWRIPLIRRVPNPNWHPGAKGIKEVKAYRLWVPVKMLTQAELLRIQEGQKIPRGSRNILDAVAIKRWSKGEADMFNAAVRRAGGSIRFTMDPRGKANYAAGEIALADLSREDVRKLEAAISPSMSKSDEDLAFEISVSRREVGAPSKVSKRVPMDTARAGENPDSNSPDV